MNTFRPGPRFTVVVFTLLLYCNSKTDLGQNLPDDINNGVRITLDQNSMVTSETKVGGISGDTLTIDSGTTILQRDDNNEFVPVSLSNGILLSLTSGDTASALVPPGMKRAVSFGISATVNGKSADLIFLSNRIVKSAGMPYSGVHWTAHLSDTGIRDGAILSFYKVLSSMETKCIGSGVVNTPIKVLSKSAAGSDPGVKADVSPDGTGNYNVTYFYSPVLNSTPATMPASGVYWVEYTYIPETTYVVGGQTFGSPMFVGAVTVGEPSTAEILALVAFADGVNCVTFTDHIKKVQFWVERSQNIEGKTTALKVASNVANIPYLNLIMYSVKTGHPVIFYYGLMPNGGIHTPDGAVLTDPYGDLSIKIGGCKVLSFRVKNFTEGSNVRRYVQASGYDCSSFRYEHNVYRFDVTLTQDSRAKIEEDVLSKEKWFPVKSMTFGNVGLYEKLDSLTLNLTSHADQDTVSTQKITLKGTIFNPAQKTTPVKEIMIYHSSGTESQVVRAPVTLDSLFSVDLNLYIGMNIFVFVPMGKSESGTDISFTKCIIKAKGEKISSLMLSYTASWNGTLELTRTITTTTPDPDTSITVSVTRISADLKIDFRASKLWYIKQSHENAVTCSGFDNCYLFSGNSSGPVTVSVTSDKKTRNCDDELPMITMRKGGGEAVLAKYSLNISATLTPWDSGDVSTERRYHLSVFAGPDFSINTDPGWPKVQNQWYDCLTEQWKSDSSKLGPLISLDEDQNVLAFTSSSDLEQYSESPVIAKNWTFTGREVSADGLTVEEYSATLSIQP